MKLKSEGKLFFSFALLFCILLAGCSHTTVQRETTEEQIRNIVKQFYDHCVSGNYEEASSMLIFSEATEKENMRDLFPESLGSAPTQSYTIEEIKKLTPELYEVNVIGVFLTPFEFVYDDSGEVIGTKADSGGRWHVDSFSSTNYIAKVNGEWGVCISARYVPEEMYDFSENELQGGQGLPIIDDEE